MIKKHYLYTLAFEIEGEQDPVIFYVGHTNDPKRREAEHRSAARNIANTEYKYRWARELESAGIDWVFTTQFEIEDDEDSEYEWVLYFARENARRQLSFFDNLPLTNMRAGDFLSEIIDRTDIKTRDEIRAYRLAREFSKQVDYQRPEIEFTPQAQLIIDDELVAAEKHRLERLKKEQEQVVRKIKHEQMLNDPERQLRIKMETLKLMLLEGIIDDREHHQLVLEAGGYPSWTNTPDIKAKKK